MPGLPIPTGKTRYSLYTGGWVGPRARLDGRKILLTFNHHCCGNKKILKSMFLKFFSACLLKTQLSSAKTVQLWLINAGGFTVGYLKTLSQLQFLFNCYLLR